jgi:hypothetical protein
MLARTAHPHQRIEPVTRLVAPVGCEGTRFGAVRTG